MNTAVHPAFSWVETALSAVGAGIAGTLWWAHRANIELPCTSGGGCDEVNASQWSHFTFGPLHDVPIALLGFLTYLVLLTLAMAKLGAETEATRRVLLIPIWILSLGGTGYSWYLQYVAHFQIGAFCIYCFSSAIIMTLLWITATWEGLRRMQSRSSSLSETRPVSHV
jgi:uncharacterized membrane protein